MAMIAMMTFASCSATSATHPASDRVQLVRSVCSSGHPTSVGVIAGSEQIVLTYVGAASKAMDDFFESVVNANESCITGGAGSGSPPVMDDMSAMWFVPETLTSQPQSNDSIQFAQGTPGTTVEALAGMFRASGLYGTVTVSGVPPCATDSAPGACTPPTVP